MSIIDHHWSDDEVAAFAQPSMDEIVAYTSLGYSRPVRAMTFFMNAELNGHIKGDLAMLLGIDRKLREILPPKIARGMPLNSAKTFLGLGDLGFVHEEALYIVFSRPDNTATLQRRLSDKTNLDEAELTAYTGLPIYGFDNLSLACRVYEIFNSIPNGGVDHLKSTDNFATVQYHSMLGAKRYFLANGGDPKTLELHEASAHIGAFTRGIIANEYVGFTQTIGLVEQAISHVYARIFNRLAELGHASFAPKVANFREYAPLSLYSLATGMTDLLTEFENNISLQNGGNFRAFCHRLETGHPTEQELSVIAAMTVQERLDQMKYFIVYKTIKGLHVLLGDNLTKYVPQRDVSALDRVSRLLSPAVT